MSDTKQTTVVIGIASPLEPEHVDRIRAVDQKRVEVHYHPEVLPPARYVADHTGPAGWKRTPEQQARWRTMLAASEVLWDLPTQEVEPILTLAPRLRWAQTTSAGVGPLVTRLGLAESHVIITTASGIHAGPLAEFVIAALLFRTKQIAQLQAWQRDHHWERYCAGELRGQTMAVVGPGRIGREVARLARAFGMRVIAVGMRNDPGRAAELGVDELTGPEALHDVLSRTDAVVLACPHTPQTERMIDARAIAAMKPGSTLINIARGVVVDEAAMIEALRSGHIGFAALDVFETEPLPPQSPLWDLPNVLVNPHSASTAYAENERLTDIFVRNLEHYLAGDHDRMAPLLDKRRGY